MSERIMNLMTWIAEDAMRIYRVRCDVVVVRDADADTEHRWCVSVGSGRWTTGIVAYDSDLEIALESLHGMVVREARRLEMENDELDREYMSSLRGSS